MLVAFDHPQPSQAAVCPIVHLVDFKVNHEERERGGEGEVGVALYEKAKLSLVRDGGKHDVVRGR